MQPSTAIVQVPVKWMRDPNDYWTFYKPYLLQQMKEAQMQGNDEKRCAAMTGLIC